MSEVDEISAGLSKEVRAVFTAALALAQLAAQRHASQVREQAARTGEAESEARRRFGAEQRMAALGITAPQTGMNPEEVARAWAQADVARAHAPEVAQAWDRKARSIGVDPEQVRAQWWRQQEQGGRERPEVYRTALAGLGMEGAVAVADADRARAEDLEQGGRREQDAGTADTRDTAGADRDAAEAPLGSEQHQDTTANAANAEQDAGTHHDRADNLHAVAEDLRAHATDTEQAGVATGDTDAETVPAEPGVWQDGHPPARLAGKSYGVQPGRGAPTGKQRGRSNGALREPGCSPCWRVGAGVGVEVLR